MKQPAILKSVFTTLSRSFFRRKVPAGPAEFRALFDRFKSVLESNNKALETITDMGETLGGEYLFDIVYVKKAYTYLKSDMEHSLRIFRELTQNRYPLLDRVFAHIDTLISRMSEEAPSDAGKPVLLFEEIPWEASQVVGGKVAHLAEVKNQLHLQVPEGFAITTAAFDEFVRFNDLEQLVERLKQGAGPTGSQLQIVQNRIEQGVMPPLVSLSIRKALETITNRFTRSFLALRSSAQEEDSGLSFAGQFETVLNVPPEPETVEQAYRKVLASLFSEKAVAYQRQMGYEFGSLKMAVGCMVMVDAVSSGVIFSTMMDGEKNSLIINATWGLGEAVVEGRTESDRYVLQKSAEPVLLMMTPGRKEFMVRRNVQGGTEEVKTPDSLRGRNSLTSEQAVELARQALVIERYFGSPRDIEWAIDADGSVSILQARPLNIQPEDNTANNDITVHASPTAQYPLVVRDQGLVVQRGIGAGKVYVVRKPVDIMSLPKGAVLVATNDSSLFAASMPFVSAIITETGSQTSHMATICRELRIPTIVNLPNATQIMKTGQEVTVVSGDGNRSKIYNGILQELLTEAGQDKPRMEKVYEFRRKRYLLRYISPLHLIDPLMEEFSPERCRTLHDILRFIHEKSVAELVESAREGSAKLRKRGTLVRLQLPVPAGIVVMDMGGGLEERSREGNASFGQITSIPFKALVHGMVHPGAWHSEAVALKAKDFLSSMMRMPDITNAVDSTAGYNVAVISREYVNMSIRFGYHFNMVDCFCSENSRNNHIYFRFAGGATDLTKRSRRLELIAKILQEYGFAAKIRGDLLIARVAGLGREKMEQVLDQTGRLIAYARQLDAVLHDDFAVDRHVRLFLDENYGLAEAEKERKHAGA
jgi:pyruvate, water dikinase